MGAVAETTTVPRILVPALEGAPESSSPERCAPSSSSGAPHGGTADGGETFPARHAWVRTSPTRAPRPGANPHTQQAACLCAAEQRPVRQPAVSGDAGATRARGRRSSRAPPRASPRGGNETDDGFRRRPLTPADARCTDGSVQGNPSTRTVVTIQPNSDTVWTATGTNHSRLWAELGGLAGDHSWVLAVNPLCWRAVGKGRAFGLGSRGVTVVNEPLWGQDTWKDVRVEP